MHIALKCNSNVSRSVEPCAKGDVTLRCIPCIPFPDNFCQLRWVPRLSHRPAPKSADSADSADWPAPPDAWLASSRAALSIDPARFVHSPATPHLCSAQGAIHRGWEHLVQLFCTCFAGRFHFEHCMICNWSTMSTGNCRFWNACTSHDHYESSHQPLQEHGRKISTSEPPALVDGIWAPFGLSQSVLTSGKTWRLKTAQSAWLSFSWYIHTIHTWHSMQSDQN